MISAEDVLSTTFRTTRFRGGYDIEEVDDYLDEVTATLAVHEGRAAFAKELLTAQGVADHAFEVTKLRESYVPADVDELLDRVVQALREHEKRAATRTATGTLRAVGAAPSTGAVRAVPNVATGTLAAVPAAATGGVPAATGSVPAATGAVPAQTGAVPATTGATAVPGLTPGGAARAQDVGASVAPVPPGAVLGLHVLTSQLQIATVRTRGNDTLSVRTPDGAILRVVAVDAGPDGVVLRTTD